MAETNTRDVVALGVRHEACAEAIEWARRECADAQEIWDKARPEWVVWIAMRPGILSRAELRLFVRWCLQNTPPQSSEMRDRVRGVLEGRDNLTYADGWDAERWLASAVVAWGRVPSGSIEATRAAQATFLRTLQPRPFA